MLISYLFLYLLSKFFNLLQGNLSHLSEQYFQLFFFNWPQVFIMQLTQDFLVISLLSLLQPGHLFLSLKRARHKLQFIPHGAIKPVFILLPYRQAKHILFPELLFLSSTNKSSY